MDLHGHRMGGYAALSYFRLLELDGTTGVEENLFGIAGKGGSNMFAKIKHMAIISDDYALLANTTWQIPMES